MLVKKDKRTGASLGTGRRKTAVVRVRILDGDGQVTVNNRPVEDYFPTETDRHYIYQPLDAAGLKGKVKVHIRASGGGVTGQAQACLMGVARAIISYNQELYPQMRDGKFLTRDSRMKERKHYGLRGARRGTQFSKR